MQKIHDPEQETETIDRRAGYIFAASVIALLPVITFGVINVRSGELTTGVVELVFAVVLVGNIILSRKNKFTNFLAMLSSMSLLILLSTLLFTGGIAGSGVIWVFIAPVILFFVNGLKQGVILSILFILSLLALIVLDKFEVLSLYYDQLFLRQFFVAYTVMSLILAGYEQISGKNRMLARKSFSQLQLKNIKMEKAQASITKLLADVRDDKEKLREISTEDEALLKSLQEAIIATDELGRIIKVNRQTKKVTGYTYRELKNSRLFDHVRLLDDNQNRIQHDKSILVKALNAKKVSTEQYGLIKKNGKHIIALVTAAPYIIDGKLSGSVITIQDISHRLLVDRAKSEFVSLASHQLRTPLTAIGWYAELLEEIDAVKNSKEAMKQVTEVQKAHKRMAALVNALLNVSRIELGTFLIEPEKVDFEELVDTVIEESKSSIRAKKQKIVKQISIKGFVNFDPKLTYILLQNLFTNAIKYTPEGGKIEIKATKTTKRITFSIKDNGYGIPADEQDKLFTKLFRADNIQKLDTDGTGLGLYIAKAIVDSAGGEISFVSAKNKGTEFTIEFPSSGMTARDGARGLTAES